MTRSFARRPVLAVLTWIALAAVLVWTLWPIVLMIFTSFKPGNEIFAIPPTLTPKHWTFDNYTNVFTQSSMPHALVNSIIVGLLVAAATLVFCFSAGYALARFKFKGARSVALFILVGQLVPLSVLLLPLYKMVNKLQLLDTTIGLAFVHLTITVPLVTWMIRNQIAAIPISLEEAAEIDGGSRFDAVSYVTLPIAAPGLAAAGMFAFLQSWHEFLFASVFATSESARTAPVALTEFATEYHVDWGSTMAASVVLTVPVVIVFIALQRYLIGGLTSGAVKG
ncbi:carbohydrate ABC transporter permease [Micromonospora sp. NBC_01796]|uniref:carbohydrate ABC transporter permease n=1 Tax=Micromonospora sp. NBC_01796 TaxID=2975987 RepID=UPI002DDA6E59|nr:carbohydrate ABC transporter permease [Micromonospora sp. NBC_01796]WSA84246.1 carbohydrate ABC transporter permease [Micromonospora sp. NBC_01796]